MIPGNDNSPVTFLLWWHRLQIMKFHPPLNWNGCPVIINNNADFVIGAISICICESVEWRVAMPRRMAAVLIRHMKADPDMKPFYIGTGLGVTQECPGTLGNIRSEFIYLCNNVPRSIDISPLSSKVSSTTSSAGGGGVDVHGRDGSGRIKSLPT